MTRDVNLVMNARYLTGETVGVEKIVSNLPSALSKDKWLYTMLPYSSFSEFNSSKYIGILHFLFAFHDFMGFAFS